MIAGFGGNLDQTGFRLAKAFGENVVKRGGRKLVASAPSEPLFFGHSVPGIVESGCDHHLDHFVAELAVVVRVKIAADNDAVNLVLKGDPLHFLNVNEELGDRFVANVEVNLSLGFVGGTIALEVEGVDEKELIVLAGCGDGGEGEASDE